MKKSISYRGVLFAIVLLLNVSCEKECLEEADFRDVHSYFDISNRGSRSSPTHRLFNSTGKVSQYLYCVRKPDRLEVHPDEECLIEEKIREYSYLDSNGFEVIQFRIHALSRPSGIYVRFMDKGYAWWTHNVDFTNPSEYTKWYRDSVVINNTRYTKLVSCHGASPNYTPGGWDEAYLNKEQGLVALQDTHGNWWNIIELR